MGISSSSNLACGSDSDVMLTKPHEIPTFKLLIVGDAEVGKTSMFLRFTRNQFDYSYEPTLAVNIGNVVKKYNIPYDTLVSVNVWDIPGREEVNLRKSYYKGIDAAIVVVDLTDPDTIEMAGTWKSDIINNTQPSVDQQNLSQSVSRLKKAKPIPILLMGNKMDKLGQEDNASETIRSLEMLEAVAKEHNFVGCVTVSAKENDGGVHTAMQSLIRHLLEKQNILKKKEICAIDLAALFTNKQSIAYYIQTLTSVDDHHPLPLLIVGIQEIDEMFETASDHAKQIERDCIKLVLATKRLSRVCCITGITDQPDMQTSVCILNLKEAIDTEDEEALEIKEEDGFIELIFVDDKSITPMLKKMVEIYQTEVLSTYQSIKNNFPTAEEDCHSCLIKLTKLQKNISSADAIKLDKSSRQKLDTNRSRLKTSITLARKAAKIINDETQQMKHSLL